MIRAIIRTAFLSTLFGLVLGCETNFPSPPYPKVETHSVSNLSTAGVTFQGDLTYVGNDRVLTHGFLWGKTPTILLSDYDPSTHDKVEYGELSSTGIFKAAVQYPIQPKTVYYAKAYVFTGYHTVYGSVISFQVP